MDGITIVVGVLFVVVGVMVLLYYGLLVKQKKRSDLSINFVGAGIIFYINWGAFDCQRT